MRIYLTILIISMSLSSMSQTYYKVENDSIVQVGLPESYTLKDGTFYYKNFRSAPDSILKEEGWFNQIIIPEYDTTYQTLGNVYYDTTLNQLSLKVNTIQYDLQTLKEDHRRTLDATFKEASQIIIQLNNRYNPMGVSPERIPPTLKSLLQQVNPKDLLVRGTAEIDTLSSVEEALEYKVRGPEVEGYINALKSFL